MTPGELWKHPQWRELTEMEGNGKIRYELLSPCLANLYQDTIIYKERSIVVAKLSEIDLTTKRFGAKASLIAMLWSFRDYDDYPKSWKFGDTWEDYTLEGNWICSGPYVGFSFIPDPVIVQQVVELINGGKKKEAFRLVEDFIAEGEEHEKRARQASTS